MVEFAIVAVWLFTLIFGIIEGGFAVRARSSVNNAVDDAARRGAVAGTSPDADFQIINQLVQRDAQAAAIKYVVIFNAEGGSSQVPPGCIDGVQVPGVCNVITPVDGRFDLDPGSYGCGNSYGTQWCPIDRLAGKDDEDDIAFIGVHVCRRLRADPQSDLLRLQVRRGMQPPFRRSRQDPADAALPQESPQRS